MDISSINNLSAHASAPTEPTTPQPANADQRALIQAIKAISAAELFGSEQDITFTFDRYTGRAVARIINRSTGQLIRQIPARTVLRMAEEYKGG
jgi:uncharacterized FlaG/YvyC family protein